MAETRRHVLALIGGTLLVGCGDAHAPTPMPQQGGKAPAGPAQAAAPPAWTGESTIGAIVAERPETARLFELVEIDYCCGGAQTLAAAATEKGLPLPRLLDALLTVGGARTDAARTDWRTAPLDDLVDHIEQTHHAYLRRELPRLATIVETVTRVHGETHPELAEVQQTYHGLHAAILPHLEDEEQNVFPVARAARTMEAAALLAALAGLRDDHEEVGAAMHRLRALTGGYALPEDACALYRQMLDGLQVLERDLHTHVHLENEILLPRMRAAPRGS